MKMEEFNEMVEENIRVTLTRSTLGTVDVIEELARRCAAGVVTLLGITEIEDACPLCGTVMPDTAGVRPQVLYEALIKRMKQTVDIRIASDGVEPHAAEKFYMMLDEMARDASMTALGVFTEERAKAGGS